MNNRKTLVVAALLAALAGCAGIPKAQSDEHEIAFYMQNQTVFVETSDHLYLQAVLRETREHPATIWGAAVTCVDRPGGKTTIIYRQRLQRAIEKTENRSCTELAPGFISEPTPAGRVNAVGMHLG